MANVKKQYLLVDEQRFRRNSAPGTLANYEFSRRCRREDFKTRASMSDFSILLDNQSESNSSLEIDTSTLSLYNNSVLTAEDSPSHQENYQNLPAIYFEVFRTNQNEDSTWKLLCSRSNFKAFLLAQMMSGCLTIMDFMNISLRDSPDLFFKNGQNFPQYFLLSVIWTTQLACRNDGRGIIDVFKLSGLRYVLLSAIHVEANFLLLSALQHSSYVGSQMIDCVAASLSLALAYVCLEVQFQLTHISGFMISICGAIFLSIANVTYKTSGDEEVSWGDILRIGSGLFLAFNSMAQELIVKSIDSTEYLGMVGFIGSIICGLQSIVLESTKELPTNSNYWISMTIFSISQLIFSCLAPKVLRNVGTTGLHLALLSSGFYGYFISFILQNEKILYFLSYAAILLGSYVFTVKRTTIGKHYFYPVKVTISKGSNGN